MDLTRPGPKGLANFNATVKLSGPPSGSQNEAFGSPFIALGHSLGVLRPLWGRSWVAFWSLLYLHLGTLGRSLAFIGRSWVALGSLLRRAWSL